MLASQHRHHIASYGVVGELLYYPQAKIYDHTLLTKQSYAFDA